ncbi:MAG: enoyl-CoA hydratase/isomerase family protein [Vitreoscilla sp.]
MSAALVRSERQGGVALLTLANPPVNSLSHPARLALWRALAAADEDPAVDAIVLTGADRGFCAGGELGELHSPRQQEWPGISSHLLPRIEACTKPVVAAMHGFAVGGGLELALACHYRVADRRTRIALPEIRHGVLPPSGSQRMPRAIGVARALALIVSASTVAAEVYADTPLFDALCVDDVVAASFEFLAALDRAGPPGGALLRHRPLSKADARAPLASWRERLAVMPDASDAMRRCVDAVECAVEAVDFDAGLAEAKRMHDELSRQRARP